jgi:hypothetical protein
VVQRTISKADDATTEDDVSRWLLGIVDPKSDATLKETRTIRLEETKLTRMAANGDDSTIEDLAATAADESGEEQPDESADIAAETDPAEKSSSWNFFKKGKPGAAPKKQPGKLPPRPDAQSKDSREAAADILREMTRRR